MAEPHSGNPADGCIACPYIAGVNTSVKAIMWSMGGFAVLVALILGLATSAVSKAEAAQKQGYDNEKALIKIQADTDYIKMDLAHIKAAVDRIDQTHLNGKVP